MKKIVENFEKKLSGILKKIRCKFERKYVIKKNVSQFVILLEKYDNFEKRSNFQKASFKNTKKLQF